MVSRKRLFYDIETSFCQGHFWRPGYNQNILPHQVIKHAQIICISWKWEGDDKLYRADWGLTKQCDKKLLTKFIKELDKADEIVAHNGDRFDIKWIRTRALYHDIPMKHHYNSIDTLKLCKRYLKLPSNTLAEVCKYYNLVQKKDPGGIQTWIDIIFGKSKEALDRMLDYCDGDIVSLEAVFNKLKPYVQHNLHYAVLRGDEKFHCPECSRLGMWNKTYTTRAGTTSHYLKCRDASCGKYWKVNNKTYQDYFKYKIQNGIK
jgi:hypothetical protein